MANQEKFIVAVFDFDGTITYKDSLLPFILFTHGWLKTIAGFLQISPALVAYSLKLKSRQATKETILKHFFGGISVKELDKQAKSYAVNLLPKKIKPEALKRIQWHLNQKHRCIIASASIENYVVPWAKSVGFHDILSSKLEISSDDQVLGPLKGLNCWGPEKTRRLLELLGPKETFILYAYGDSRGDQELLAMADHPFFQSFSEERRNCACH